MFKRGIIELKNFYIFSTDSIPLNYRVQIKGDCFILGSLNDELLNNLKELKDFYEKEGDTTKQQLVEKRIAELERNTSLVFPKASGSASFSIESTFDNQLVIEIKELMIISLPSTPVFEYFPRSPDKSSLLPGFVEAMRSFAQELDKKLAAFEFKTEIGENKVEETMCFVPLYKYNLLVVGVIDNRVLKDAQSNKDARNQLAAIGERFVKEFRTSFFPKFNHNIGPFNRFIYILKKKDLWDNSDDKYNWLKHVRRYISLNRFMDATICLDALFNLDPKNKDCIQELKKIIKQYLEMKKTNEIEAIIRKYYKKFDIDDFFDLAMIYSNYDELDKSNEYLQICLDINKNYSPALNNVYSMWEDFINSAKNKEAEEIIKKFEPYLNKQFFRKMGEFWYSKRDYLKAFEICTQALRIQPPDQTEDIKIIRILESLIGCFGENEYNLQSSLLLNLAQYYKEQGYYRLALEKAIKAIEITRKINIPFLIQEAKEIIAEIESLLYS